MVTDKLLCVGHSSKSFFRQQLKLITWHEANGIGAFHAFCPPNKLWQGCEAVHHWTSGRMHTACLIPSRKQSRSHWEPGIWISEQEHSLKSLHTKKLLVKEFLFSSAQLISSKGRWSHANGGHIVCSHDHLSIQHIHTALAVEVRIMSTKEKDL